MDLFSLYSYELQKNGHFTILFNKTVEISQENKVKNVKIYVDNRWFKAKHTHFILGLKEIKLNFYFYYFSFRSIEFIKNNQSLLLQNLKVF
jgi:hypothetical protein